MKTLKYKLFNRCRELSIGCYIISFVLPVYSLDHSIQLEWGQGMTYEDDSLQIVFERMCIQTQGKRVIGFRDYSVIPEVIFDKRQKRSN